MALDERLEQPVELHAIGGFVMTLLHGISRETADLDLLTALPLEKLAGLQRLAGEGSDMHRRFKVYLQPATVAMYPENYRSRLVPMCDDVPLRFLRILALEAHDLALTKLDRNSDTDRQDVQALAAAGLIAKDTLLERYGTEYRPNLASGEKKLDLSMELWVEMCWPVMPT